MFHTKTIALFMFALTVVGGLLVGADMAFAQDSTNLLNINVDDDILSSRRLFQLFMLVTVLSLAPSIVMMVTSFTRIVIVLSFLRTAMGLQNTPPNPVLIALAMFLTMFVMAPTFEKAYEEGIGPYIEERIDEQTAIDRTIDPFRDFMGTQVGERELDLFVGMLREPPETVESARDVPLQALIPAFMITELRRAFEIGFLLFLPFLVIDLAVASILMSMGMMMLPPVIISLPFKIVFFVLIDGWSLLTGSLVQAFNVVQ
ncbi:MAG: flagellar biosynthetic protein FliP [Magnetococcales bacterium]|nr:flagellar biosynthetic protein FliP [Magnetococcales bacterium]